MQEYTMSNLKTAADSASSFAVTKIVKGVVIGALLIAGTFGCDDPVSDDAAISASGTVLETDGTAAGGQNVELYKSDLSLFNNDLVLGTVLQTTEPFREQSASADGSFAFDMTGSDANGTGGGFAAFFALVVQRGAVGGLAVATNEFQYSNQTLDKDFGEIQFWDDFVVTSDSGLDFSWSSSPTSPREGLYNANVVDRWMALSDGNNVVLDPRVLSRDATTAQAQMFSLGNDRRYRTTVKDFSYDTSSLPEPIDYTDADNNNRSATNCGDADLFDLNDGLVVGADGVEDFNNVSPANCVQIALRERTSIDSIILYNATVLNFQGATLNVEIRDGSEADWTIVATFEQRTNDFSTVYAVIDDVDADATDVRLSFTGNENAFFAQLGEVEIYAGVAAE